MNRASFLISMMGLLILPTARAVASEPDNFTNRPSDPIAFTDREPLEDLNRKTNQLMEFALDDVKGCELQSLHVSVKKHLAGAEIGKLEAWATTEETVHKTAVPLDQSIYRYAEYRSVGIGLLGIVPSLIVNGHYIGTDKLGHFFDQGYMYYEAIFLKHADVADSIAKLGYDDEAGMNGLLANGIRSYGDMAANFSGYLFWREVAAGANPYYRCVDGKFARTERQFDWAEYVNDAWDEALNCNEYDTPTWLAVRAVHDPNVCPLDPGVCRRILDLPCGFSFLSPSCLKYVKPTRVDSACIAIMTQDYTDAQACLYPAGVAGGGLTDLVESIGPLIDIKAHGLRQLQEILLRRGY